MSNVPFFTIGIWNELLLTQPWIDTVYVTRTFLHAVDKGKVWKLVKSHSELEQAQTFKEWRHSYKSIIHSAVCPTIYSARQLLTDLLLRQTVILTRFSQDLSQNHIDAFIQRFQHTRKIKITFKNVHAVPYPKPLHTDSPQTSESCVAISSASDSPTLSPSPSPSCCKKNCRVLPTANGSMTPLS